MIKVPVLPLSALIFYLLLAILWNLHIIPLPKELIEILEGLYQEYGYSALVLATLLEGISYICLYFPGAFIIALTVFFSDKSFVSLLTISTIVSATLTVAAFINYRLGRYLASRNFDGKNGSGKALKTRSRGFIASMLHPNFLAFYFLNEGIKQRNPKQMFYVPLFMLPYGLFVAYLLSTFSSPIRHGLESPTLLLTALVIWFTVATVLENKKYFENFKIRRNP